MLSLSKTLYFESLFSKRHTTTFSQDTPVSLKQFVTLMVTTGLERTPTSNLMSNAALNVNDSSYDVPDLAAFSIHSPRQLTHSNEYPSITSCCSQHQTVLTRSSSS